MIDWSTGRSRVEVAAPWIAPRLAGLDKSCSWGSVGFSKVNQPDAKCDWVCVCVCM